MRALLAVSFLLIGTALAVAQQPRPSREICDKVLAGRPYVLCLEKAMFDSNRELEALVQRILGFIDMRDDLAPPQKGRWKSSLEEAQVLFVRFRNHECQTVAPFESSRPPQAPGGGRLAIGSFEERLLCLIDKNVTRMRELEVRYVK
ncbi:MAG: DUF1311 domain-containing protein [Xanthobacteraceae bacterium]|nr:DUF1311 domain-containing protein [Xanthobacteraceae bacterium]